MCLKPNILSLAAQAKQNSVPSKILLLAAESPLSSGIGRREPRRSVPQFTSAVRYG